MTLIDTLMLGGVYKGLNVYKRPFHPLFVRPGARAYFCNLSLIRRSTVRTIAVCLTIVLCKFTTGKNIGELTIVIAKVLRSTFTTTKTILDVSIAEPGGCQKLINDFFLMNNVEGWLLINLPHE